ncbi:MAG: response regulator [Candidatus Cloacimonadota bacterium]|nr:MAG: response regulator [Candidatus Cloacimonadota bacterium]
MKKKLKSMKICTVDNDKFNVQLIKALLHEAGYKNVKGFYSGEEMIAELEKDLPDLILSDIMMPKMNGYELCRIIKKNSLWKHIPVIMITAATRTSHDSLKLSFDAGAMDFLSKPVDNIELTARVTSALKSEYQRKELERALEEVKQLKGLLPICSYCKKIRTDDNYWDDIESYICTHSEAEFSHSICPSCYTKFIVPELEAARKELEK